MLVPFVSCLLSSWERITNGNAKFASKCAGDNGSHFRCWRPGNEAGKQDLGWDSSAEPQVSEGNRKCILGGVPHGHRHRVGEKPSPVFSKIVSDISSISITSFDVGRISLLGSGDGLFIDDKILILSLDCAFELGMNRIILEHIEQVVEAN